MKRILGIVALTLIFATTSFAAETGGLAHQNTGCGLGTMLFQANANDSSLLQAFQATTNGTLGNQTFGISSGTSECTQPKKFVQNERLNEFVYANLDSLAKDIAQGRGESVQTLAELMQIAPERREGFYRNLQSHFTEIFPRENVEYAQVVDTIVLLSSQG
ncbi:MAG: hypothetical protein XU12_C0006G0020 [Deltaproteobacteria bacterium CSP1-8]|nr:MAG: hypothetical protein XU12_C0006G0020 [Deltaproteobacteria bacterium CSP1-8]